MSQKKFSKTAGLVEAEPWKIPLTINSSAGAQEPFVFETAEKEITIKGVAQNGWIKLNADFMNWHQEKSFICFIVYSQNWLLDRARLDSFFAENGPLNFAFDNWLLTG